jgi:hypothetical protein
VNDPALINVWLAGVVPQGRPSLSKAGCNELASLVQF